MLKSIIEFSVRNKLIIALFTLGLTVLGIYETSRLPIDAVPDITDNQVQVITVAPSFKLAVAGGSRGAAYNVREAYQLNTDAHGLQVTAAVRESSGTAEPSAMQSDPWRKKAENS